MTVTRFDAIVIGAGHNGLTAAATLARAGKSVCVLERRDRIGGMAAGSTLGGASLPEIAHLIYNLSPAVGADLALRLTPLPTVALCPDGRHVVIDGPEARFADGTAHPDAAAFAALHKRLSTFAALLARLADHPPPALAGGLMQAATRAELGTLAKLGLDLKRLGKAEMREFLRVILSNAYDLILDDLSDGPLAGALAADAVRGAFAGPRAPGTVFSLMYRLGRGGTPHLPIGGMGAVAEAFAHAARSAGADIRTRQAIDRLVIAADRVQGVLLTDGSTLHADTVLSSIGPAATMHLTGIGHFDTEATRRIRTIRARGTAAKLNLVLSAAPVFPGLSPAQTAGRLVIAPSATAVERAFNPVKYGQASPDPLIEAVIPTLTDDSLAAQGTHILSAIATYVPHTPDGGWTGAARADLQSRILATLDRHAPGLSALVTHAQLLTPPDIEAQTGAPGGHWHHAEMGIDQVLTLRPANGIARYALGPGGLYLCGASAHPGGDVTGAPGRNAARAALADMGVRR